MTEEHKQHLREAALRRKNFEQDNPHLYPKKSKELKERKRKWRNAVNRLKYHRRKKPEEISPSEKRFMERTGHHSDMWLCKQRIKRDRLTDRQLAREEREDQHAQQQIEADREYLRTHENPFGPQPQSLFEAMHHKRMLQAARDVTRD